MLCSRLKDNFLDICEFIAQIPISISPHKRETLLILFKKLFLLFALLSIFFQLNCQSPSSQKPAGIVQHIILCWLNNPQDESAKDKIIETSNSFKQIPGIVSITAGSAFQAIGPL
jgi:hypothetical protein